MMKKYDDYVKNMENLKIEEPKFEKWNELPPELKLECIKTLDFKTRWNLRRTCHLERSLVDSQKVEFEKIKFSSDGKSSICCTRPGEHPFQSFLGYHSGDVMIAPFEYIMEHGIIEKLKIVIEEKYQNLSDRLSVRPWSVKVLKVRCESLKDLNFCLERLNEKVERIEIDTTLDKDFSLDSILTIPQIINVPFLEITDVDNKMCAHKLANVWITNDVKIGQTFQLLDHVGGSFGAFKREFSSRIVSETIGYVRIRTENPSKHILLQVSSLPNRWSIRWEEILYMSVVPAEMKETEYDIKWVRALQERFPENYEPGAMYQLEYVNQYGGELVYDSPYYPMRHFGF